MVAKYNERLFSGTRSLFHNPRFTSVRKIILKHKIPHESVIELGCFDGRAIKYLPSKPKRYHGLDADWEGGLSVAKETLATDAYTFQYCDSPNNINTTEKFQLALCMETLEHLPDQMAESYLKSLSQISEHILITVPVEKGPLVLPKHLLKSIIKDGYMNDAEKHSIKELFFASIGRMDKVTRVEHKGFDYAKIIEHTKKYFDTVYAYPYPLTFFPLWMSFGVSILGRSKFSHNHHN